jgi:hypothetical protein
VIDPSAPDTVYLGTSRGVFKSLDAGATWLPINAGLPFSSVILPVPPVTVSPVQGRP